MAVNEVIVSSFYRRLIDKSAKLWQRISYWTKSSDVEFSDGRTAEEKLGDINGITSDFSTDNESISASSRLTHAAYDRFQEFTDNGRINRIIIGNDGKLYIEYKDGADTVLKKLGNVDEEELINSVSSSSTNAYTKGTWLYCVSYGTIVTGDVSVNPNFSLSMSETKCSISDSNTNHIKKIFAKQSVLGNSNHREYCALFIYMINVCTETASINVIHTPSSNNHFDIISNKCKLQIAD